jgi:hypothetical protein
MPQSPFRAGAGAGSVAFSPVGGWSPSRMATAGYDTAWCQAGSTARSRSASRPGSRQVGTDRDAVIERGHPPGYGPARLKQRSHRDLPPATDVVKHEPEPVAVA